MEPLLMKVYGSIGLCRALKLFSHFVSLLSIVSFGYIAYLSLRVSLIFLTEMLVILALPFIAVTLLRRLINAPRPYELYGFYETAPKQRSGASFPSRHAHSAFAIGTLLCFFSPYIGAALLSLSAAMCIARVLLGVHFPRDVIAGALTGTVCSLIGALLFI